MFAEVSVGISPCGAVRDHVVGACCAQFGHHQGGCGGRHDDGAVQVQSSRRVDGSEASVTAAGGEDVWFRAGGELFEAAENVVADTSIESSAKMSARLIMRGKLTVT